MKKEKKYNPKQNADERRGLRSSLRKKKDYVKGKSDIASSPLALAFISVNHVHNPTCWIGRTKARPIKLYQRTNKSILQLLSKFYISLQC